MKTLYGLPGCSVLLRYFLTQYMWTTSFSHLRGQEVTEEYKEWLHLHFSWYLSHYLWYHKSQSFNLHSVAWKLLFTLKLREISLLVDHPVFSPNWNKPTRSPDTTDHSFHERNMIRLSLKRDCLQNFLHNRNKVIFSCSQE